MPKLKRLSGSEVITIFNKFGFAVQTQKGSHVKLRRVSQSGSHETLTIPLHSEIDTGALRAILRQAGRYIPQEQLKGDFYAG